MQGINEKLAYLQGLAEGLNVGQNTPEGRVLVGVLDVLGEMARSMDRAQTMQSHLEEYMEAMDEDLTDLEDEIYEEDLEFMEYDDDLDLDDEDTAIEYMEMSCPSCDETVFVDEDVFEDEDVAEVLCPECNETVLVNDAPMDMEAIRD